MTAVPRGCLACHLAAGRRELPDRAAVEAIYARARRLLSAPA
ncbi:MAG TPA: hypothetical protein VKF59_05510 [Candidatus Dormibacteraeota bacterium]|nr:hypothetical protein [Candidatus Dormibacteraeota bacterium]